MSWTDAFINTNIGDLSDGIQVAEMVSANSCKIGDLILTADDLLFNENLTVKLASKVSGQCPEVGALQDTSTYINPLKAGDRWRYTRSREVIRMTTHQPCILSLESW